MKQTNNLKSSLPDGIGMVDCCENNGKHGDLCDNLTCECECHE